MEAEVRSKGMEVGSCELSAYVQLVWEARLQQVERASDATGHMRSSISPNREERQRPEQTGPGMLSSYSRTLHTVHHPYITHEPLLKGKSLGLAGTSFTAARGLQLDFAGS